MTKIIDSFTGENAFLSNFWIEDDGSSVEHFFQASKTLDGKASHRILNAETPGKAKRLGRQVRLRPDWEEIKDREMRELVEDKFQDPFLHQKLLDTGDVVLVEGNTWGDTYWGACWRSSASDIPEGCTVWAIAPPNVGFPTESLIGQNKLGQILMNIRGMEFL